MNKLIISGEGMPGEVLAQQARCQLQSFLHPLLARISKQIDLRLFRTFKEMVEAIIRLRDRPHALYLTELGRLLLGGDHTPAGVKRIQNLLASLDWSATDIEEWLWEQADDVIKQEEGMALVVFDESVWEKPESTKAAALCPVRSAKARRLSRPRPGFGGGRPGKRVTVPGMNWLEVIALGMTGPATLAARKWWTTRGEGATALRSIEYEVLARCALRWGRAVRCVFDRGFAGSPFITKALELDLRAIVRWPKRYHLCTVDGEEKAIWRITAGKRAWGQERVWDPKRRCWLMVRFFAVDVRLPGNATPLWLVVSRGRKGTEPWRLLTNEPITTVEQARSIVQAYARRWQVECTLRFSKSELGMESLRLKDAEQRRKLLQLATLVYAFLVALLTRTILDVPNLLRLGCHRTGKVARESPLPIYRLRHSLAELWNRFLPHPLAPLPHLCQL